MDAILSIMISILEITNKKKKIVICGYLSRHHFAPPQIIYQLNYISHFISCMHAACMNGSMLMLRIEHKTMVCYVIAHTHNICARAIKIGQRPRVVFEVLANRFGCTY